MDDKERIINVIESISEQLLKSKMSLMDNVKGVILSSIHFQYIEYYLVLNHGDIFLNHVAPLIHLEFEYKF